jgi:hypothetical protein
VSKNNKLLHHKENQMKNNSTPSTEKTFGCETCPMRKKAEANPKSFMARLWRWHTNWCPGWKEYQAYLAQQANA